MKVLQFTKNLMGISGILPRFDESFMGKTMEILKLILLSLGPLYASLSTLALAIVSLDNLPLMTSSLYISIGCAISISLHFSHWLQSHSVQKLLEDMELLVNERIGLHDFGYAYTKTDVTITKLTKTIGICWCISIFLLTCSPFMSALFDYITGKYSTSSWVLIYPTLNPWDMAQERNIIMTVVIQACCAAPIIVYYILIPQFLFLAVNRYFFTFIEDVKMVIKKFDKKENVNRVKANFVEMIDLHSRCLEFIKDYGQIMNAPIFIVNTFNLICMCTILFQVKDSLSRRDYAELHLAITANFVIFQMVFSFCFLGDQITTKAAEVNLSIYDCNWYNYPFKYQKFIVSIIERAQKPFILTGYSLVSCSLQSFKEILNFVASAFLFLIKISE